MDGNEQFKLLTPKQARDHFNATDKTLREWAKSGKIECVRLGGKLSHRRYKINTSNPPSKPSPKSFCYARVSSNEQKKDLERQIQLLQSQFPNHTVISDVGSGLNFQRKGLKTLLDKAINGDIEELVVTHKDRLCRFGFQLFEHIIAAKNGKILVLNEVETTPEKEIVEDVLAILTVFSARIHGRRSNVNKRRQKDSEQREDNPQESEI